MIRLAGAAADGYVAVLRQLLAVARPGVHYPDARRLDAHLSFLGPAGSRGVHEALELDAATGLPTLGELLRVRADRDLADGFLREHGDRLPAKAAYYRALAGVEVLPTSAVLVRLRRRERQRARFEVVHDRIEADGARLVRTTVQLEQRGVKHVGLERGDLSAPTETFRRVVERWAGVDAELAFLLLAELPGVRVDEVVRGEIGPLSFAGVDAPPLLAPVFARIPGAFVLHLALERAGVEVAEDRCRDPFARLYRDALGPEARAQVDARRLALGYHVAKERRLVCTPSAEEAVREAVGRAVVVRSR